MSIGALVAETIAGFELPAQEKQIELRVENDPRLPEVVIGDPIALGIPADVQERIFNEFTQTSYETTRQYGGTGPGLAIARRLLGSTGAGGDLLLHALLHAGSAAAGPRLSGISTRQGSRSSVFRASAASGKFGSIRSARCNPLLARA